MRSLLSSAIIVFGLFLSLTLTSCNRQNTCDQEPSLGANQDQLDIDIQKIDAYLSDNGIEAEVDPSGIRYVIDRTGAGPYPTLCGSVDVTYQGRLLSNGYNFDGTETPRTFDLNRLILGWQIGIPMIKPGGRITLYIPSVYGYGSQGAGQEIPPNANLIFDITLYSVD